MKVLFFLAGLFVLLVSSPVMAQYVATASVQTEKDGKKTLIVEYQKGQVVRLREKIPITESTTNEFVKDLVARRIEKLVAEDVAIAALSTGVIAPEKKPPAVIDPKKLEYDAAVRQLNELMRLVQLGVLLETDQRVTAAQAAVKDSYGKLNP